LFVGEAQARDTCRQEPGPLHGVDHLIAPGTAHRHPGIHERFQAEGVLDRDRQQTATQEPQRADHSLKRVPAFNPDPDTFG